MADQSWKGKSRGGKAGYAIFLWLLNHLGLGFAYGLLAFVAFYFIPFAPGATKNLVYYFRHIQKYLPHRALISLYRNYFVFGQSIIDRFAIMGGHRDQFTYHFDGEENLVKMGNENGGIVISAHIGNWDIAGNFLNRLTNTRFNVVMFHEEHEQIQQLAEKSQIEKKMNIIAIKDDMSHLFKINNAIGNKEILCFHGDRFMGNSKRVKKKFMGKEAYFPLGPFQIIEKYQADYSFAFCLREKNRHYHLFASAPKKNEAGAEAILDEFITALEQKLQDYPLQWFNYYKFWS